MSHDYMYIFGGLPKVSNSTPISFYIIKYKIHIHNIHEVNIQTGT